MTSIFTCSTDDGHPSDLKMAELLFKHGLNGTFFVPIFNCEGQPVLNKTQLRDIAQRFEIGSHTLDHCYLNSVGKAEARRQIVSGKSRLEEIIEQPVAGFCYPGGKFTQAHVDLVEAAGFVYARTTLNLCFDIGARPFEMPTTIQFYPHSKAVYIRNYVRIGNWVRRAPGLLLALKTNCWIKRMYALFDYSCQQNSIFHIWGHSYEIDQLNAWPELDRFLAYVASRVPVENRLSNHQLASRAPGRWPQGPIIAG
jgi:gamma-glutamylcyclotransferase (GGCT)/AIG2-like uncharacterized protein YtfP